MGVTITKALKKFLPHLLKARDDNLQEADTSKLVVKFFEEVLCYDPLTEISCEAQINEKFVDLALKPGGAGIKVLVEVKPAGVDLKDKHIEQAKHYAAEGNLEWVVLTNSVHWNLYHLTFSEGVEYDKAFSVDLAAENQFTRATDQLSMLHRQSVLKGELDDYWQQRMALSASSIGKALFTDSVLKILRRELRRSEKILIDDEDLARAIHEMFSVETREQIGPLKIRRKPIRRKAKHGSETPSVVTLSPQSATNVAPQPNPGVPASQPAGDGHVP